MLSFRWRFKQTEGAGRRPLHRHRGVPQGLLSRLNPDGTVDATVNVGADAPVAALGLQGDGELLVGGSFNTLGGVTHYNLARLVKSWGSHPELFL